MTVHVAPLRWAERRHLSPWTWLAAGLAVGFLVPFVFADVLGLQRDVFYAVHGLATLTLIGFWLRVTGRDLRSFVTYRWRWGVGIAALVAPLMALLVVRAEEGTPHPDGLRLAGAILWRGLFYGAVDGLLLSVFPILLVYAALEPHRRKVAGKIAVGAAALLASLAMTGAYHLGYSDFRGEKLRNPVAGDVGWSLPTLLTTSPVGAPIVHAAMHVTAVVHSYDTELFLPPHAASKTRR